MIENLIKRKDDKLYVKWKVHDNSLNRQIDDKDILYKMSYYPEQDSHIKSKLELDCLIMQQNLTEKK